MAYGIRRDLFLHYGIESDLEQVTHLQKFLLELGRGFSFVARQKRITFDGFLAQRPRSIAGTPSLNYHRI